MNVIFINSYQDVFNEALSLAQVASRWLYVRLDFLSAVVVAVAGFTFIGTGTNAGTV